MAEQPQAPSAGSVTPDGRWRWDGRQWVPNAPVVATGVVPLAPGTTVIAPKSPALSLIVSIFLPGVGSMINGEVGKGVGILVLYVLGIVLAAFLVGIPLALGAWIWGLIDAYQGAERWNRAHGIVS